MIAAQLKKAIHLPLYIFLVVVIIVILLFVWLSSQKTTRSLCTISIISPYD